MSVPICQHDGLTMYLDRQAMIDSTWLAPEGLQKPLWWRCPGPNRKHDFWEHPGPTTALTDPSARPAGRFCEGCGAKISDDRYSLRRKCRDCKRERMKARKEAQRGSKVVQAQDESA